MSTLIKLKPARDELKPLDWDYALLNRSQRYLRDMRMLGATSNMIADFLHEMLDIVEPRHRRQGG